MGKAEKKFQSPMASLGTRDAHPPGLSQALGPREKQPRSSHAPVALGCSSSVAVLVMELLP